MKDLALFYEGLKVCYSYSSLFFFYTHTCTHTYVYIAYRNIFIHIYTNVCLSRAYGYCVHFLLLAETPIEEFTPTPAFPALQYLESVDLEGVAWRAGLRTGDFLIEVRACRV